MPSNDKLLKVMAQTAIWQKICMEQKHDLYAITTAYSYLKPTKQKSNLENVQHRINELYEKICEKHKLDSTKSRSSTAVPYLTMFLGRPLYYTSDAFLERYSANPNFYPQGVLALVKNTISGKELIKPFNERVYYEILDHSVNLCGIHLTELTPRMPSPVDYIMKRYTLGSAFTKTVLNFPN